MRIRVTYIAEIEDSIWQEFKTDLPDYSDEQILDAIIEEYPDFEDEFHSYGESYEILGPY